jgi:N-acyl-D-aspartate/D-glutamate deacylase
MGEPWPFESFPEYLDAIDARGSVINVAPMVGHTPVRLYVMGEESTERAATPDEVQQMRVLVADALDAGAVGFATSKSPTHLGFEGRPVPSRSAELGEIAAIATALRDAGRGVIQATMGPGLAFAEFAALAVDNGCPISWTALLAGVGGPGIDRWMLTESIALLDRGIPVHPQVSCRPLTFEISMEEPFVFESMRAFGVIAAAPDHATKTAIYRDPVFRTEFREQHANGQGGVLGGSWDRTVVSWFPPDPLLEGRVIADLAAEQGVDPSDLMLDLALEADLETRFRMAVLNFDEDMVQRLLTDEHTMLGLSDAGAHASQLCDAGFATHLLGHWVRERQAFPLEEAVRKLTSEPADIFGLTDRGRLAVGRPADVVVLDPDTVGCTDLTRVHDLPSGADRLIADATGIDAVLANGVIVRRDGHVAVTGDGPLPGRLLRGGAA